MSGWAAYIYLKAKNPSASSFNIKFLSKHRQKDTQHRD